MLAWLTLISLQGLEPAPATSFDRVVPLAFDAGDPVLVGHGRSKSVEYSSEFSGMLHVWTKAEGGVDLFLRIEDPVRQVTYEDDNSGGGKTPYLSIAVESGSRVHVCAAVSGLEQTGTAGSDSKRFELHFVAAPESDATREGRRHALLRLQEIKSQCDRGDLGAARDTATRAIDELSSVAGGGASQLIAVSAWELGSETYGLSLMTPTRRAWGTALSQFSRTLPDEHHLLQAVRLNLANTIGQLGDLPGALGLQEKVLAVFERTLPDEDPDLLKVRQNLAMTLKQLGELSRARALEEKVLEIRARTLPDDDLDLQQARGNLAGTLKLSGDLQEALALQLKVLEVFTRTLHDEDPNLLQARQDLATIIGALGNLQGARSLLEKVLEVRTRNLPPGNLEIQWARWNLAATISGLGDLQGARTLQENVLEALTRQLPEENPYLQGARVNLAVTIRELGDLEAARALEEKALEVFTRTLSAENLNLQTARESLATTMELLGNLQRARELEESVLDVRTRALPAEDRDVQATRLNLARTIMKLGDCARARALQEKALEALTHTLPDEHPDLQAARQNLATNLAGQVLLARNGFGVDQGEGGRERCTQLLEAVCRANTSAVHHALITSSTREAEERCVRLTRHLDGALAFAAGYGAFEPVPELERAAFVFGETTRGAAVGSAALIRRAAGSPKYRDLRGQLQQSSGELAGLAQHGTTSEAFQRALAQRESIERSLVALAHDELGGSPAGLEFGIDALAAGLMDREVVVGYRRYKHRLLHLSEVLGIDGKPIVIEDAVDSLCAHVLRKQLTGQGGENPTAVLIRVDLGPIAPIESAVRAWRESLGTGSGSRGVPVELGSSALTAAQERGRELRRLVFDPLLPALQGARDVIVALDDVLHLVPLDVLPLDASNGASGGAELVGERWRIETRVTLAELLAPRATARSGGELLAVGGVDFASIDGSPATASIAGLPASADRSSVPIAITSQPPASGTAVTAASTPGSVPRRRDEQAGILRGGPFSGGFSELPGTGREARGVVQEFSQLIGGQAATLLEGGRATRERLLEVAPRARWLHIATHGWFAPESIRSWSDPEPIEKNGMLRRTSGAEQVKGMSPMLLCGLALAGANLPENALGRVPGLITAEELAAVDLSNCELAVLSACDTNVGERRAGQGVAGLQQALQMAGVRSVITSLWKVPDEATRELMLEFYERIWVEKKPKWQALWEAKMKMRAAKDGQGNLRYAQRDWAAWVLTGEPD